MSVIPKGCTQYLQFIDTSIFSIFKNHYRAAADEYIDLHGSRIKIKLSAKQQRILCTRLISTAWNRTQNSVDFARVFRDIGYTWVDDSPITLRTLPGFVFDPTAITSSTINDDENEENEEHEKEKSMAEEDKDLHVLSVIGGNKMKQLSLYQFMKK
jgi:hypothetical protein